MHYKDFIAKIYSKKITKKYYFLLVVLSLLFLTGFVTIKEESTATENHTSGFIPVDHGQLFYQRFGTGAPIIVLHDGHGLDHSYLLPQMLELAQNHEVIFYDQRGSGKSLETSMTSSFINITQFTKDLEALRKNLGLKKFTLIGHAWGGLLAMKYAISHPERITALILLNTEPASMQGQQAFMEAFANKTLSIQDDIRPLMNYQQFKKLKSSTIQKLYKKMFSVYFNDPNEVENLTLTMNAKSAKSGAKVMEIMKENSSEKWRANLLTQLQKLSVPTLIVAGKQDIFPLWTAEEIKKAIPHAQMVSLDKCGHFPYIEKPNELFFQIRLFLTNKEKTDD